MSLSSRVCQCSRFFNFDDLNGRRFLFLGRQFGVFDNRFYSTAVNCHNNLSNTAAASVVNNCVRNRKRNLSFSFGSHPHTNNNTGIFHQFKFQLNSLQIYNRGFKNNCVKSSSLFRKHFGAEVNNCNKTIRMMQAPTIKLNNGQEMPILGLGTYMSKENEGELAIKHAIDLGYRHIDTAYFYQNECEVGKSIKDKIAEGVVTRDEIFVVTKLWNTFHSPDKVEYACRKSLASLGLDYIDLYLMHVPVGYKYVDDESLLPRDECGTLILSDVDYMETWCAMEKLVEIGLVRSIGVSNFNSEQIDRILSHCTIKPVTNQVECHPALNQKKLIKFCKERDITVTAYSPLGRPKPSENTPNFIYSETTKMLAEKYNRTPAQIVLRYLLDIGTIPIPKSVNNERIKENFDVFSFKLNQEDICLMDQFNDGDRLVPFSLIKAQNHKYFPFNIEF